MTGQDDRGSESDCVRHSIVLTTLNARYWHSSFGLRYLMANLGELRSQAIMLEFGISDSVVEIAAELVSHQPRIVGIGVYLWNVRPVTELVSVLRQVAPDTLIVLGGPEVSYDTESQPLVGDADYVITGEADLEFADLCRTLLKGERPVEKIRHATPPQMSQLTLPYDLYTEEDIAHRVIYVEASRGCPFTCEFCLSALDIPVRQADVDLFLQHMQTLLNRGVKQFKFVDRTFNLNLKSSRRILTFFLDRWVDGLFLHFEMIPDRLPDALRELIARFPPGALQFEIGVQTFNDHTGTLISRRQDNDRLADNFRWLRSHSGVHLHADLIVGLPGEDYDSFGRGFDRLLALQPQEIQVGILKRLKGTPIVRHDDEYQMLYSQAPPYEILQTREIDFDTMMTLRRFARVWDLVGNSGNFVTSVPLMWNRGESPFARLIRLTSLIMEQEQRLHGIALGRLAEYVFRFLATVCEIPEQQAAEALWTDYNRSGRTDRPKFLRGFELAPPMKPDHETSGVPLPRRQQRHRT